MANAKLKRNTKKGTRQKEFGILPAGSHIIPPPDCHYLAFAPKSIASTTPYSQGFRVLFRHSQLRLESPWVGPTIATLKNLKLATVTLGTTLTLSVSSASLFLCRFSGAFSSFFLQPCCSLPSPTRQWTYSSVHIQYRAVPNPRIKCGGAPVKPKSRRSPATQSVHYFSFSPRPRFSAFSSSPDMMLFGNLWSPMRRSASDHDNLLVRTVVTMLLYSALWRASLKERVRLSGDLHQAHRIRSNILWSVLRSFL